MGEMVVEENRGCPERKGIVKGVTDENRHFVAPHMR
jgi:hypothetical protein